MLQTPVTAKQIVTGSRSSGRRARRRRRKPISEQEKTSELFAKPRNAAPANARCHRRGSTAAAPANHACAHHSVVVGGPHGSSHQILQRRRTNTNHDITVRIPDSTDQGTAVRFVERAGEIHVSVRTSDAEMAQTLRGGLNDLVNHLEDGGIRTRSVATRFGSNSASSQNDSQQPFADPDGSNGRQYSSGSNSEQESKQQNKPRWVEELEGSIGNPNFKETTQLLWQA